MFNLCQSSEHPVQVYPLVAADPQGRTVNKTYPGATAHQTLLQEKNQWNHYLPLQLRKSVVRYRLWEKVPHMRTDMLHIEMFQAFVITEMEQYHDSYNLRIRQLRSSIVLSFHAVTLWGQAVYLDEFVIYLSYILQKSSAIQNISVILFLLIIIAIVFVDLLFY